MKLAISAAWHVAGYGHTAGTLQGLSLWPVAVGKPLSLPSCLKEFLLLYNVGACVPMMHCRLCYHKTCPAVLCHHAAMQLQQCKRSHAVAGKMHQGMS